MSDSWRESAKRRIYEIHKTIPADATLKERTKAIDDAYPFGPRKYHPYKMWLIERRAYLARYGYRKRGLGPTPLEQAIDSAGRE